MAPQPTSQRRKQVLPPIAVSPLEQAWQAFLGVATAGRAEATKEQHKYIWNRISLFCQDHQITNPSDWTDGLAYEFGQELQESGLSKATVHRHLMILHRWLKWAKTNPTFDIGRYAPKAIDQPTRKGLNSRELKVLFQQPLSPRDKFMLEFMLGTGLRISEIFAPEQGQEAPLTVDKIENQLIEVRGQKTGSYRMVGIPDYLWRDYLQYIRQIRPQSTYKAMFLNDRKDNYNGVITYLPLTISSIKTTMRRLRVRTGIDGLHAHALRHTYAFNQIEAGMSLPVLMKQLGHTQLSTTQIYLGLDSQTSAEMVASRPSPRPAWLS